MKISPVRAAQTFARAGFCATLSGLSPADLPTRGRREARQPRAVYRSPFRASPYENPQVWDFLRDYHFLQPGIREPRKGFRNTARGCAAQTLPRVGGFLKISPVRAAQTPARAGFCATLSGLSPADLPTRGRREARQPRAVYRSPFRHLSCCVKENIAKNYVFSTV